MKNSLTELPLEVKRKELLLTKHFSFFTDIFGYTSIINSTEGTTPMALFQIKMDWKHVKSYATEAALMKKIEQDKATYADYDDRFLVVRTPEGRWTAVVILDKSQGGYIGRYDFVKV
jgi:hypothetical protein